MENDFESDLWSELIEKFGNSIKKSLEVIKERDIENP